MTTSQLPARPDLAHLKKQAKDLLQSAREKQPAALLRFRILPAFAGKSEAGLAEIGFALHDAQSVIAREYGYSAWNTLRERVEELTLKFDEAVAQFARGSVEHRLGRAERLLALHPGLVAADFHASLVFGDVDAVARHVAADPAIAVRRGGPLNWEPILYVAHSRWADRNAAGLVAVARLLLQHGADANTHYSPQADANHKLSVLWAAACHSCNRELAQCLLEAGARPDDGESVYHAAENGDVAMLDLLAKFGAQTDGGTAAEAWGNTPLYFILGHYAGMAHDAAVRRGAAWLLAHGANPNRVCYPDQSGETAVHAAARHWDVAMMELLAQHGAQLRARRKDGRTAFALAALHGNPALVAWLRAHDGADELSGVDRFLAACTSGERAKVEAMLRGEPKLAAVAKHPGANKLFFEMAGRKETAGLETMLAAGFDPGALDYMGATPLHWAAFTGNLAGARVLIARGAPLDVRDRTYNSPPLGWCDYADTNRRNPQGDYVGIARALLEAGATPPNPEELENWGSEAVATAVREFARKPASS